MMEWTMEMQMVVAELTEQYVEFGEGCEDACAHCPYAAQCHAGGSVRFSPTHKSFFRKSEKNLSKGIDKPAKMSIIVTVRMRCGKHPKEGEPDDDELDEGNLPQEQCCL